MKDLTQKLITLWDDSTRFVSHFILFQLGLSHNIDSNNWYQNLN